MARTATAAKAKMSPTLLITTASRACVPMDLYRWMASSYPVSGLAWKDHEFSTSVLDENQIGWDWFSLQFEDGPALMLFQLRERDGGTSASSSGTFIATDGTPQPVQNTDFEITVLDEWRSPHTQGVYPAAWEIRLNEPNCLLEIHPWMADQEINFPAVTYWEGAVHFEGTCNGASGSRERVCGTDWLCWQFAAALIEALDLAPRIRQMYSL